MGLIAFYPQLRLGHEALVACSGALFAVRGGAVLAAHRWPLRRPWRVLSVVIDTGLMAAGLTLWALLQINPYTSPWLGTKLALLLLYIALGAQALRGRTPARRAAAYAAALATFGFMVSVALAHDPRGLLLRWWS